MATIKIINKDLFNKCVKDAEFEKVKSSAYNLFLSLTDFGLRIMYPENYDGRPSEFDITGEFGEYDYIDLGFELVYE